jgi:hypothetical protein
MEESVPVGIQRAGKRTIGQGLEACTPSGQRLAALVIEIEIGQVVDFGINCDCHTLLTVSGSCFFTRAHSRIV